MVSLYELYKIKSSQSGYPAEKNSQTLQHGEICVDFQSLTGAGDNICMSNNHIKNSQRHSSHLLPNQHRCQEPPHLDLKHPSISKFCNSQYKHGLNNIQPNSHTPCSHFPGLFRIGLITFHNSFLHRTRKDISLPDIPGKDNRFFSFYRSIYCFVAIIIVFLVSNI